MMHTFISDGTVTVLSLTAIEKDYPGWPGCVHSVSVPFQLQWKECTPFLKVI